MTLLCKKIKSKYLHPQAGQMRLNEASECSSVDVMFSF